MKFGRLLRVVVPLLVLAITLLFLHLRNLDDKRTAVDAEISKVKVYLKPGANVFEAREDLIAEGYKPSRIIDPTNRGTMLVMHVTVNHQFAGDAHKNIWRYISSHFEEDLPNHVVATAGIDGRIFSVEVK